ncbi:MAG TPA: glycoside hydrolase family 9 protein, partial [Bacteroidales bacterium]|nr:glycoside hydrolase family 9 protein [Bacteroidales bacterium]
QTIYVGDFSEFQTPGDYLIKAPDNGQSYPFTIGTEIYDKLYDESLKTFYIQRCGMELKSEFAGDFAHSACHTDAAKYYPDVNKAGTRNVPGGWHDAGDYGRYIVNGAYSVAVMLTGYEHFPKGFQSDNIGIPESGNSIPDLLDEIRYEIEWMLKMQDEDGGLFHKVTEPAFQALDLKPHEDEKTQVIMIKTSAATADFAIATAMAGRIYLQYDKTFADQCKAAALKAWEYLENHPDNVPKGGFRNPADIRTGTYGDADDADERFWAAVELYRTFQEKKFGKYIAKNIDDVNLFPEEIAWRDVAPFGVVNYLKFVEGDPDFMQKLTGKLKHFCNDMLSRYETNGYGILLNPGDYRWGSLQIDLNFGFILLAGGYIFDNEDFKRAATHQIHYMLGANGLDQSFVTGFGERSPQDVHNR